MDDRIRAAERAFESSGSPEDGAQVLRLKMAAGILTQDQLEMAARLGYEPALFIYPGESLCDGLDEKSADGVAEHWTELLNRFPVMYAALLLLTRDIVRELRSSDELADNQKAVIEATYQECLNAFAGGSPFVDSRGDLFQTWTHELRNSRMAFGVAAIFNLAETWVANEMNDLRLINSYGEIAFYNMVEFSPYTIEARCMGMSEVLVPWILEAFPPQNKNLVSLLAL